MPSQATRPRLVTADEAVSLVRDGDVVLVEGSGGGLLEPDTLLEALGRRYRESASPSAIDLVFVTAIGDNLGSGFDHLAQPGLIRRAIGGMWGKSPRFAQMAMDGEFEAYNFPQGVLSQLCREVAGNRPGVITKVGLGMFCDPRQQGGRLNERTTEDLVEVLELDGEEWLRYRPFRPDIAFIRGSVADENGNVSFEDEPAKLEALAVAQAAHNSGGTVIVQVKTIVEANTLDPRLVVIPGILVDVLVVSEGQRQLTEIAFDPSLSGGKRTLLAALAPLPFSPRKIIARRALQEISRGDVVNLGVGMAAGVAAVATEEGCIDAFTLTVEQGLVGGMPAGGLSFGASYNPAAILDQAAQFDFYDGGGLDLAFLGLGQIDRFGNVNVSRFSSRLYGTGGFVNISQSTRRLYFCATFSSDGLAVSVDDGRLTIVAEGRHPKFVHEVEHITFNGRRAVENGHEVTVITERAVFELRPNGIALVEVAPGIDVHRDVLDAIPFDVEVDEVRTMDERLFELHTMRWAV